MPYTPSRLRAQGHEFAQCLRAWLSCPCGPRRSAPPRAPSQACHEAPALSTPTPCRAREARARICDSSAVGAAHAGPAVRRGPGRSVTAGCYTSPYNVLVCWRTPAHRCTCACTRLQLSHLSAATAPQASSPHAERTNRPAAITCYKLLLCDVAATVPDNNLLCSS